MAARYKRHDFAFLRAASRKNEILSGISCIPPPANIHVSLTLIIAHSAPKVNHSQYLSLLFPTKAPNVSKAPQSWISRHFRNFGLKTAAGSDLFLTPRESLILYIMHKNIYPLNEIFSSRFCQKILSPCGISSPEAGKRLMPKTPRPHDLSQGRGVGLVGNYMKRVGWRFTVNDTNNCTFNFRTRFYMVCIIP